MGGKRWAKSKSRLPDPRIENRSAKDQVQEHKMSMFGYPFAQCDMQEGRCYDLRLVSRKRL